MLSTCCGGLRGGAGDVEPLPLTGAAAAGVTLEKEDRPQSFAGPGRGGRNVRAPQEGSPPSSPGRGFPAQAHLCCCERASWVPRLPDPGRAGENPSMALRSGTESCSEELPEHDLSTSNSLAQHSNLAYSLSWSAGTSRLGETRRPDISSEERVVTIHRSGMSQSVAWTCCSPSLSDIRTHRSVTSPSITRGHHRPSLGHVAVHPSVTSEPIAL